MTTTPATTGLERWTSHREHLEKIQPGWRCCSGCHLTDSVLDELAEAKREIRALTDSDDAQVVIAQGERDAAREELAKTRAELDEAKAALTNARDLAASIREQNARIARGTNDADTVFRHSMVVMAYDDVLDVLNRANPATTAEPADEPKAKRRCAVENCDSTPLPADLVCDRHPACGECGGRAMHDLWCKTARARRLAGVPAVPDAEPAAS